MIFNMFKFPGRSIWLFTNIYYQEHVAGVYSSVGHSFGLPIQGLGQVSTFVYTGDL